MAQVSIPLTDDFTNKDGRFVNYDTYVQVQNLQLAKQKHVDIRSFVQANTTVRFNMLLLNTQGMSALDNKTMTDLIGSVVIEAGEAWTNGTVGKQADRNHWYGIQLTCAAGVTTTSSVIMR